MSEPTREEMEQRLLDLAERIQGRLDNSGDSALSPEERVFLRIWELEAQVNNGGFHQYFFNSSGQNAPDAPSALRSIGAEKMAVLVDQALRAVGNGVAWLDDTLRQEAIVGFGDSLHDQLYVLDAEFYEYPDDLTAKLFGYVDAHRSDFALMR